MTFYNLVTSPGSNGQHVLFLKVTSFLLHTIIRFTKQSRQTVVKVHTEKYHNSDFFMRTLKLIF